MPGIPPVLGVVGKKKSGKTTLIEKLVSRFNRRGYRIGTIKHAPHGFDPPVDSGDSGRHARAGAVVSMVAGPGLIMTTRQSSPSSLEGGLDRLLSQLAGEVDLVIAEGFKKEACPKIEIFRPERHEFWCCLDDPLLLAVVADVDPAAGVPRFGLNEIDRLAEWIAARFLTG
ncbi:MAG: molybdopterin-guanine dinucleotide biosynthesis protein B [Desulfosudaceae bacterium]